jgi:hypothetical protein
MIVRQAAPSPAKFIMPRGFPGRFRSKPPAMSRGRSRLVYQRFAFVIIFREAAHIKL